MLYLGELGLSLMKCHCKVSSFPLSSTRNTTKGPGAQNPLTRPNEFHAAR